MKPFIPWIGGKRALIHEILPRFPIAYDRYVEVFGGGASVLFAKREHRFEVYNDYLSNLVNLFKVVKDKPLSFLHEMNFFPLNSKQEFEEFKDLLEGNLSYYQFIDEELELASKVMKPLEYEEVKRIMMTRAKQIDVSRAVTFFKMIRLSYSSTGRSFGGRPISMKNINYTILRASHRLRRVVIENKDYKDLIKQHDDENTFFYCDPPYYQTERYYDAEFDSSQHVILKDILSNIKGMFLLSYNDCEFIRDLYKDFSIVSVSRLNNMKQQYEAGSQFEEVLIANYDITQLNPREIKQVSLWDEYEDE